MLYPIDDEEPGSTESDEVYEAEGEDPVEKDVGREGHGQRHHAARQAGQAETALGIEIMAIVRFITEDGK